MITQSEPCRRPLVATALVAIGIALAVPASANAAVTMGRANPTTPAGGGNCDANKVYTLSKSAGQVVDTAPITGVITSWSTRATDTAGQQAALKTIAQSGATFTVQQSSFVRPLTPSSLNTFTAHIPIKAGERIGYFFTGAPDDSQSCHYNGVQNNNEMAAGTSTGQPGNSFTNTDGSSQKLINLQATIEPDADKDTFGDESQDKCPGTNGPVDGCAQAGTTPPPSVTPDTTKPSLTGLSFSRTTFRAAGSGSAFTTQKKRKRATPVGTKVSFRLSEDASVRFTVQRKTTGRRSGRKCRTATRRNRKKPKCTLWKTVRGSFTFSGTAGRNSLTFRGRIGGRKLSSGSYRLVGTATDPVKNRATPKTKSFRIVRR